MISCTWNLGHAALTWFASTPTEKQPHRFAIDPKSKYMIVSGEKSETLSLHSIDASNCALLDPRDRQPGSALLRALFLGTGGHHSNIAIRVGQCAEISTIQIE